jgi:CRP-like cAMP-binding protein
MKTDKGVEVLVRQGWLSMTPLEFQVRVLAECVLSEHAAGETIYRIGDPPGGIYGVLAGSFGISFASNEAGPHLAHFVRRGAWVGEAAAVTDLPRRVGLVAVRETKAAYLPLPAIRQITSAQPITWRYFAFLSLLNLDIAWGPQRTFCFAILESAASRRSCASETVGLSPSPGLMLSRWRSVKETLQFCRTYPETRSGL